MTERWQPDEAMAAFVELDHDRVRRRGYPEAVYCEGKTLGQVSAIAVVLKESGTTALFARADPAQAEAILLVHPPRRVNPRRPASWENRRCGPKCASNRASGPDCARV